MHFHSSEETMRKRMSKRAGQEHRMDDTVETHEKRLRDFMVQGPAVINRYQEKGKYSKVGISYMGKDLHLTADRSIANVILTKSTRSFRLLFRYIKNLVQRISC